MSQRPGGARAITNKALIQYVVGLVIGMTIVHGYTAIVAAGRITVVNALLLAGVAAYIVVFRVRHATALRMRAYAGYFVHVLAYLIVNGSYWMYAGVLTLTGQHEVLQQGWAGPLFAMSSRWGIGLAVHTIGAMLSRGYENVEV